jgi:DNA-binding NtrC family response regulator
MMSNDTQGEKTFSRYPINPVLIVDNDESFIDRLEKDLRQKTITHIKVCKDGSTLKSTAEIGNYSFILLNISIPYIDGKNMAVKILEDFPKIPLILITTEEIVKNAVKYMQQGAFYYYLKKNIDHIKLIEQICQGIRLYESIKPIITRSKKMRHVFREIGKLATTDKPVLLKGEAGVEKDPVAEAIHKMSSRKGNFVRMNITGFDDTLFAQKLFGHIKGTIEGEKGDCNGLIEKARGGTLFMDEIGDLHIDSQAKLLRLIQDGTYYKPGSAKEIKADVRLIAFTKKNIEDEIRKGNYLDDFFWLMKAHTIFIPPLRERKEDIPLLVEFFIREALTGSDFKQPESADDEFIQGLLVRNFKRNISELRELIHKLVIGFSGCERLTPEMLESERNNEKKEFNPEEEVKGVIQNTKEKLASSSVPKYKCLTVFLTDLVGSTSGKTEYGHKIGMIRIHYHNTLASETIKRFEGKVIKYMGDGVLAVFEDIINAIKAAIVLRDSLAVIEDEIKLPLKTRVTLTHGQVEELDLDNVYDIGGQEVDKAARIQKEAAPGQILADYQVIRNAKLSLEANPFIKIVEITDKEGRKLDGLDEPVRIVEITT